MRYEPVAVGEKERKDKSLEHLLNHQIFDCELFGCVYNEDGTCRYCGSDIRIPEARACYEEDFEARLDAADAYSF